MNASLPFGPPINTDIDFHQAYYYYFFFVCVLVMRCYAWFVREEKPVLAL